MAEWLDNDIKYLKGVGEARAKLLAKEIEVTTFRDLIYYFPFRHADRSRFYRIEELEGSDLPSVQIKGKFINFICEGEGKRQRLRGIFTDGKKFMETVWFSGLNYFKDQYQKGVEYVIFGKPTLFHNIYSISHPEIEIYNPEKPPTGFRGIYSLTETLRKRGFSSRFFQSAVMNILSSPEIKNMQDPIPTEILKRYGLMPLGDAIMEMHFPQNISKLQKAIERFKFEELFYIELHILRYSLERGMKLKGLPFKRIGEKFNLFYDSVLPFHLTDAQKRVLKEIWHDMKSGRQMNRLLQGDVGSGKTMVAFMTMLMAIDNGYQAAFMAPTEILATQHYQTLKELGDKIGVKTALLTGSTKTTLRREIHSGLLDGSLNIIVGTHALIEDKVEFKNLGLAVIDEQHRFGVAQRGRLWSKGEKVPHVLVMTATPIPRTLAMTVYGDLDVSVINELPPGRKPITTLLMTDASRMETDRLIFSQLKEGRQIYIVYPLINENEKLDLRSLEEGFERTCEVFKNYNVCFVHGKMKPDAKERQMDLFVRGEAQIMVATTVIEVGVNVPNATVMVIENAERFGLSQLHQLRGRVGRGGDKSYCVLMSKNRGGENTKKRLSIMTETNDGFIISEADMKIRGPGDMEGTRQSGMAFNLKVANLARDGQILTYARKAALSVLKGSPGLLRGGDKSSVEHLKDVESISITETEHLVLDKELHKRFSREVDWSQIS